MGMNLNNKSKMLRCTGTDDIITLKADGDSDSAPSCSRVVNMEWGNFWSSHLPRTSYDIDLDDGSPNRHEQKFRLGKQPHKEFNDNLAKDVSGLDDDEEQAAKNTAATMAVQEMKHAYYFTFVTLINMVKDEMASNITFLMPNDRMLSNVSVSQNKVMEFISMHSIPSLLMFEDLMHLPSGTVLPTNHPNFTITISNEGRKKFYFDEVQLNSPNICSTGSSFHCHGIDGVLKMKVARNATGTPPPCVCESPSPSPTPQQPAVLMGPLDMGPAISPIPADSSLGSRISDFTNLIFSTILLSCIMLFQV